MKRYTFLNFQEQREYMLGFAFKWPDLMNEARHLARETGLRQLVTRVQDDDYDIWVITPIIRVVEIEEGL